MNVIIAYLDAMFSAYPQTPRLLEAKAELQGMMEDAYASLIAEGRSENEAVGQVIRDFGNLEEVAPVLGITSDLSEGDVTSPAARTQHPPVTLDEAQGYADALKRIRFRFSAAVMLFVISPAALLLLTVAANSGLVPISEGVAAFVGLMVLLAFVATGVVIIVATARETAPFRHLSEGRFAHNPAVARWADALAADHERARTRALQISVALWILAPIPLIAFALLLDGSPISDFWSVVGVVLVLVFVAAGLGVLLPNIWARTIADELGAGTGSKSSDEDRSIVGVIAAFYWPLLTAIFLAWSFIGNAWGISWVVWPVGAVLFGAIAAGGSAIENYRTPRR